MHWKDRASRFWNFPAGLNGRLAEPKDGLQKKSTLRRIKSWRRGVSSWKRRLSSRQASPLPQPRVFAAMALVTQLGEMRRRCKLRLVSDLSKALRVNRRF
jgi:hypothetical protein